jgi:hypothetical protein
VDDLARASRAAQIVAAAVEAAARETQLEELSRYDAVCRSGVSFHRQRQPPKQTVI